MTDDEMISEGAALYCRHRNICVLSNFLLWAHHFFRGGVQSLSAFNEIFNAAQNRARNIVAQQQGAA